VSCSGQRPSIGARSTRRAKSRVTARPNACSRSFASRSWQRGGHEQCRFGVRDPRVVSVKTDSLAGELGRRAGAKAEAEAAAGAVDEPETTVERPGSPAHRRPSRNWRAARPPLPRSSFKRRETA